MSSLIKRNLSQYINDSIKLSKSTHIYLDTLKTHSRIMTYKLYGVLLDDNENKYNLNMAGLLSTVDQPVIIEGNELNKDLIANNTRIKESLLKFDSYYDSIVNNNRVMSTYIKGCLTDTTLEDVLNAKDGKILWYNKDFFTNDENAIIPRVQNFIYDFLDTYNNKDYIVDELYAAGLVSNLYSVLPTVILVEKLNLALTSEADDFHIYHFFKSYKGLDNEVDALDRKTLIWLYGNLRYMKKHIGSNEVLNMVIKHVMSGLGIGKVNISKSLPKLADNTTDIKSNYYTKDILATEIKINDDFIFNNGKTLPVKDILEKELDKGYIRDESTVEVEDELINLKMRYSLFNKERSKILILDEMTIINIDDINKFSYFLNAIIYQAENFDSNYYVDFLNPLDGLLYKLNSKQILGLFIYLTSKIFINSENPFIETLSYAGVLDLNAVKNFDINNYNLNQDEINLVNEILKDLDKVPSELTTLESFRTYINVTYDILHKFWYYLSNINDTIYSSDLLYVLNSLFSSGDSTFINNKYIKDYLSEVHSPILEIDDNSIDLMFKKLLDVVLGTDIYKINALKSKLDKIIKISNKLTSYTIQFLYSNTFSYIITGHYQTLKTTFGRKTCIGITDATFSYYDKVKKEILNKFLPIKDFLLNNNIVNTFRLYKPYKLELVNLSNHMLTNVCSIYHIKTGDKIPYLLRPDIKDNNIITVDDITVSNLEYEDHKVLVKPNITAYNNILTNYINHNLENIKFYSPEVLGKLEDEIVEKDREVPVNVKYPTKPIVKQVPELTEIREDIDDETTVIGLYSPDTDSSTVTDNIEANDSDTTVIRNIEQPTIRVSTEDDLEDVPIIKIKR